MTQNQYKVWISTYTYVLLWYYLISRTNRSMRLTIMTKWAWQLVLASCVWAEIKLYFNWQEKIVWLIHYLPMIAVKSLPKKAGHILAVLLWKKLMLGSHLCNVITVSMLHIKNSPEWMESKQRSKHWTQQLVEKHLNGTLTHWSYTKALQIIQTLATLGIFCGLSMMRCVRSFSEGCTWMQSLLLGSKVKNDHSAVIYPLEH